MAIKLADTARPNNHVDQNHLGSFPVAYAEDIWFSDGTRLSEKKFEQESAVGISDIAKTSTNGLVDTYTITLTNGTKKTFTVTNGKNGSNGESMETMTREEMLDILNGGSN